jgi:phosphocarrier protein HPr
MYMQKVTVNNKDGLHARPATFFVQGANKYPRETEIWIEHESRRMRAKSMLGVLSLGIMQGTTVNIIADGPQEKEAVESLVTMIENNFAE